MFDLLKDIEQETVSLIPSQQSKDCEHKIQKFAMKVEFDDSFHHHNNSGDEQEMLQNIQFIKLHIKKWEKYHNFLNQESSPSETPTQTAISVSPTRKNHSFSISRYEFPELLFFGDQHRLHQVLSIFLRNGLKYSNPHGNVTLTVIIKPQIRRKFSIDSESEELKNKGKEKMSLDFLVGKKFGVLVEFMITDDGMGMSEAQIANLFKPYSAKTSHSYKGFQFYLKIFEFFSIFSNISDYFLNLF